MNKHEAIEKVKINSFGDREKTAIALVKIIYDGFDKEILKLKKHDRSMRDMAHKFNKQLKHIESLVDDCMGDDSDNNTLFIELSEYLHKIKKD